MYRKNYYGNDSSIADGKHNGATMQWYGNSYSAQRDLFIYTSARVAIDHVRPQTRELPTGGRYW